MAYPQNMNQTLKTTLVGFAAGLAGAYAFSLFGNTSMWVLPQANNYAVTASYSDFNNNTGSGNPATGTPPNGSVPAPLNADFVRASAVSTPCVVYIKTESEQVGNMWDFYFGFGSQKTRGSGSGVIFTADGYIVTNNHVIDNAQDIEVIHQKRSYKAKVVGTDPSTDIAVLKIEGKNLPSIRLSDSKKVNVGEWVLAVGNPFNLNSTVTAGIVSAKGRNLNIVNSQFPIESFIQTDAAINPGNSGGALVNLQGELVGINTAIYSQTGSYAGYGFAVPSDIVGKVVDDLIKHGIVQKAFFGANVTDMNTQLAEQLKVTDLSGVAVSYIQRDGAADRAGLQKGDIILKINEATINSRANFDEEISYYNPGDRVKITYRRDNKTTTTDLVFTNNEGTTGRIKRELYEATSLNATLEPVSKVERERYGIEGGVRVNKVGNGLLRRLGIGEDFIITGINRQPIHTPEQVESALKNASGKVLIEGVSKEGVKGYYSFYF